MPGCAPLHPHPPQTVKRPLLGAYGPGQDLLLQQTFMACTQENLWTPGEGDMSLAPPQLQGMHGKAGSTQPQHNRTIWDRTPADPDILGKAQGRNGETW